MTNTADPIAGGGTTNISVDLDTPPTLTDLVIEILDPNNLMGAGANAIVRRLYSNRTNADLTGGSAVAFNTRNDVAGLLIEGTYVSKAYEGMNAVYDMKIQGTGVELNAPTDVATDSNGNIYVANYDSGCVLKINPAGTLLLKFGCRYMATVIEAPLGVAVDSNDNIYVAARMPASANYRIELWNSSGALVNANFITGANVDTAKGLGMDRGVNPNRLYIAGCGNVGADTNYICRYRVDTGAYIDTWNSGATAYDVDVVQGGGNIHVVRGDQLYIRGNAAYAAVCNIDTGTAPAYGVVADASGYAFITSAGNDRIQKYSAACALQTSFGSVGSFDLEFLDPWGIGLAVSGNDTLLYVADNGNNRIKIIEDVAAVTYSTPADVAMDASGNIYVANSGNGCIMKLDSAGSLQFQFGCGSITTPLGVAVDSSGNIYVAANNGGNYRIEQYSSTGALVNANYITGANVAAAKGLGIDRSTNPNYLYIAGCTGAANFCRYRLDTGAYVDTWTPGAVTAYDIDVIQNGGNIYAVANDFLYLRTNAGAAIASIDVGTTPARGVAVDSAGNAFITSQGNDRIQKYNTVLDTLVLQYQFGTAGAGNTNFNNPWGIAIDEAGDKVYVGDSGNNRIKKVDDNVPSKQFSTLTDMAIGPSGNIYVANAGTGCIQKMSQAGALLLEFGCSHQSNAILSPQGIAVDAGGNIYIAANDGTGAYRIEKWNSTGTPVSRAYITGANVANAKGLGIDRGVNPNRLYIAGCTGANNFCRYNLTTGAFIDEWAAGVAAYDIDVRSGGNNIYAVANDFLYTRSNGAWAAVNSVDTGTTPARGVFVDTSGNAYITSEGNDRIQKYNSGLALQYSHGSAGAGNDQYTNPRGIAYDSTTAQVLVADSGNARIKVVDDTVISKQISTPSDVARDAAGNIYVANSGNGCVQKLDTSGNLVFEFGCSYQATTIATPLGVAVDSAGNIYVTSDSGGGLYRVEKWDNTGTAVDRNYITGANVQNAKGLGIDRSTVPNYLYIAGCNGATSFCRYNLTTGAYVDGWNSGTTAYDIDVVQNGGDIYMVSDDDLYRRDNAWAAGCTYDTGTAPARGVTIDNAGNAYVTNQGNDIVIKFNNACAVQYYFGDYDIPNNGNNQFNNPWGVAVNAAGTTFYVADSANNRIKAVDNGNIAVTLSSPRDIALDAAGDIYVVNNTTGCVDKMDQNGNWLKHFGCNTIDNPLGIAVDGNGFIYITHDTTGAGVYRIEKWNADGLADTRAYIAGGNVANANGLGIDRTFAPQRLYISGCTNNTSFCRYELVGGTLVAGGYAAGQTAYDVDVIPNNGNIYTIHNDDFYRRTNAWGAGCNADTGGAPAQGISVENGGDAHIAQTADDEIEKRSAACGFLYGFGGAAGAGNNEFDTPNGIAADPAGGWVFVADTNNNRIKKVQDTGAAYNFNAHFAAGNVPGGMFNTHFTSGPTGGFIFNTHVDTGAAGSLSYNAHFTSTASSLTFVGHINGDDYSVPKPIGMDVDPAGNLYVALQDMAKVKVFTYNGQYYTGDGEASGNLGTIGGYDTGGCGKFREMYDVAVWDDPNDADGIADRVYVSFGPGAGEDLQCYNVDTGCWNNGACCGTQGQLPAQPGNGCGAVWGNVGLDAGARSGAGATYNFALGTGFDGRIYLATNQINGTGDNDGIFVYNPDGSNSITIDTAVTDFPWDVAVDANNNVVVTNCTFGSAAQSPIANGDCTNDPADGTGRLYKYVPNNNEVENIAIADILGGAARCWGISMDKHGNVYAACQPLGAGTQHAILRYGNWGYPQNSTAGANHVLYWMDQFPANGASGTGDGQFNTPMGVAVDPEGNWIWVADYNNNRLQKFLLTSNTTTDPITVQCAGNPAVDLVTLSGTPVTQISGNTYSSSGAIDVEVTFCKPMDTAVSPRVTITTVNAVEFVVTQTSYTNNIWKGTVTIPGYTHALCGNGTAPSLCDGQAQISVAGAEDTLGNPISPDPTNPVTAPTKTYLKFIIDSTAPNPPTITSPLDDTSTTLTIQPVAGIAEANSDVRVTITTFACVVREAPASLNDIYNNGVDTQITGACTDLDMLAAFGSKEFYYDKNGNSLFDDGEWIYQDTGTIAGFYDATDRTLLAGLAPNAPVPGDTLTAFDSNEKVKINDYQDTLADASGNFYANDLNLALGANYIAARAIDPVGNTGLYTATRNKRTRVLTDPGVASITPSSDFQVEASGQWTIRYTAIDPFPAGAACTVVAPYDCYVTIEIPSGWSLPTESVGLAGQVTVTPGAGATLIAGADQITISGRVITINIQSMTSGSYFDLTYGATDPPGAQVSATAALGENEFKVQSANKAAPQTLTSPRITVRGLPIKIFHTADMPTILYDSQQDVKVMTLTFRNISTDKTVEVKGVRLKFVRTGATPTPAQIINHAVIKDLAFTYADENDISGNSVGNKLFLNFPAGSEIVIGPGAARSVFVYFDFNSNISTLGLTGLEILLDADAKLYTGVSTGLTANTMTDAGASWTVNSLLGYMLIPETDIASPLTYIINKNTGTLAYTRENTMLTDGAGAGDPYAIGNADNDVVVNEQVSQVSLRAGPDTGDTFYPDEGDANPQMSSGLATSFQSPLVAQHVKMSILGHGWNQLAEVLSKGQTGSKPYILKQEMYDQLLVLDCTPTCAVLSVADANLFNAGNNVILSDTNGTETRVVQSKNTGVNPNTITLTAATSRAFLMAGGATVTRQGANVQMYSEIFTVWDCHTNTGPSGCNVNPADLIAPGGPNTVISRMALRESSTVNYFTNDSSIEAAGTTITLDTILNPIKLDTDDPDMNVDVLLDVLCSPGYPDCSTGTTEPKLRLSLENPYQVRPSTFSSLTANCAACATVNVSDASKFIDGGRVVVADDAGYEWKTVSSHTANTVTFTSAVTGTYTTANNAYVSHTRVVGSFPLRTWVANIQDHAVVTVTDVDVPEDALCPSELDYGMPFTVDVTVQNQSGNRAVAVVYPSANDLKFTRNSDGLDYTSQFTVTAPVGLATVVPGATATFTYDVVQDMGTTTSACADYFISNAASAKPYALDGNDYSDSDPLVVNYDTNGDDTPPNEPSVRPSKAYVRMFPVAPTEAESSQNNVLILDFSITDSPGGPAGENITHMVFQSHNDTDADVAANGVKVWEDVNDNGVFEPSGPDTMWGSASFAGGFATVTFAGPYPQVPNAASQRFFVSYDIATAVTDGDIIDASIKANGILLQDTPDFTIAPTELNSSGQSTINVQATHIAILPANSVSCAGAGKILTLYAYDDNHNIDTDSTQYVEVAVDGSGEITDTTLTSTCYNPPTCGAGPDNTVAGNLTAGMATINVTDSASEIVTVTPSSSLPNPHDAASINYSGSVCMNARSVTSTTPPAAQTNVLITDIKLTNGLGIPVNITSLVVNNTGTASDAEIASVFLYYDSNNNGTFNAGVDQEPLVGSGGVFAAGTRTFNFNVPVAAGGTEYFFIVYNLATVIDDGDTLEAETPINGLTYNDGANKFLDDIVTNSPGLSIVDIVANTIRLIPDHTTENLLFDCANCLTVSVNDASIYDVGSTVSIEDNIGSEELVIASIDTSGIPDTVTFTAPSVNAYTTAEGAFLRNFSGTDRMLTARAEDSYGNLATQLPEASQQIEKTCELNSFISATTLLNHGLLGEQLISGDLTTGTAGTTFTDNVCLSETVTIRSDSALANNLTATINFPGNILLDVTPPSQGTLGITEECVTGPTPMIDVVEATDDCAGIKYFRFACADTEAAFTNAAWVTVFPPQLNLDVCCNCNGDPRDVGCGFNVETGAMSSNFGTATETWTPNPASGCTPGQGLKDIYIQYKDGNGIVSAVPGAAHDAVIYDSIKPAFTSFNITSGNELYFYGSNDQGLCDAATTIDGDPLTAPSDCALWYNNLAAEGDGQTSTIQVIYDENGSTSTLRTTAAFGEPVQQVSNLATGNGLTLSLDFQIDNADAPPAAQPITFEMEDHCGNIATETFTFNLDNSDPVNGALTGFDTSAKAVPLTAWTWYNYANPYFEWATATEQPPGVDFVNNAALRNYLYLMTDLGAAAPDHFSTTTSNTSTPTLTTGFTYYFKLRSYDNVNNYPSATDTIFVYRYDNTPPNNPAVTGYDTGAKAVTLTSGNWYNYANPYFEWAGATDLPVAPANSGFKQYNLYFGSDPVGVPSYVTALTATTTTIPLVCGTQYYLRMNSEDNAGNATGTTTQFTYIYDGSAPTIAYNSPTAGSVSPWYSADPGAITNIDLTWGGCAPLTSFDYRIVGASPWLNLFSGSQTSDYTTDWTVSWAQAVEGNNQISISGHDAAGNGATDAYVVGVSGFLFRKDVSAPNNLTTPASAWSDASKATAIASGTSYTYVNPYFEWAAPDDNPAGVNGTDNAGVDYYYVGFSTDPDFNPTATQTATSYSATPTACGVDYYLVIKAADAATPSANVAATTTKMFRYVFDGAPPGITNNMSGDDTWRRTDPGAIYNVDFAAGPCADLDRGQYAVYSAPNFGGAQVINWTHIFGPGYSGNSYNANWAVDFANLNEGVNYVSVRTYDEIGKVTISTDTFYIRKDVTPPDIAGITINGWDSAAKTYVLTNDPLAWWNFENPYFEWADISDLPAMPTLSSGVSSYYTYFGTNISYNPDIPLATAATVVYTATQPVGTESATSYYLILKAVDVAGNVSTRTIYYYNYDDDAPNQPANIDIWEDNTTPPPELASGTWYNFPQPYLEWSAVVDQGYAGLDGYYVVFATDSSYFSTAAANFTTANAYDTAASGPVLVSCSKYKLYLKTKDKVRFGGNISNMVALTDSEYWYDGSAPSFTYNSPTAGGNTSWYSLDPGNVINIDLLWGGCGAPLSQYDYKIGAGAWTTFWPGSQSSNYTTNWSPLWASLAEGVNQISIAGYDSGGNGATDTYAAGVTGFQYRKDVTAPNNPTPLALGWATDGKFTPIVSATPYDYPTPYFEWGAVTDNPAGVDGTDNAGFDYYYVGFSTDPNFNPTATQTLTSYTAVPAGCGVDYYLVIKTADKAIPPNVNATTSKMFTYSFGGSASITNNQGGGDDTWRNADPGAIYNIDFNSPCFNLDYAQYRIWSGPNQTGTLLKDWTNIFGPAYGGVSYTANWGVDWGAATEGYNYITVRLVDTGAQTTFATDEFYVKKDTIKPTISTGAFSEASNYLWVSPANGKMYYGSGMAAAEAFNLAGTATDTTTGWLASGLATATFSFAFDDTPADDTTPAVWSGAYDIEASNTGGATITVSMYDIAGNVATAAYYAVNSNALSIEYATISQDWRPSYVVFNLYYPDGLTELTASAPTGILSAWANIYNTFSDDVTANFDILTLEYNKAACEQAVGTNAWCVITVSNKCVAAADDPHHIGFDGTSTADGFITTLAEELSTDGDLTTPDGDFLATCGPDYMVVKPEEDGLVTADATMANWCAGGGCTPVCAANYCSVSSAALTAKPDYVKYDDGGPMDQTFANIADNAVPATEEWSWDTVNKRIMLFDDPAAAAITYTPNGGSELVCIYLKDKCDQTIVIGRWEDVDIELTLSDAPNSGKDIVSNVPGATQGYVILTTPAAGDFTPPGQLNVKGTLKAGKACIRVTAESLPSDSPASPIRIDAVYFDKITGLPVTLDHTGGNDQPALIEIRSGAGVASGTTTFAGVSDVETIFQADPNDYTMTVTLNPVWDSGGDTLGFISRQGNPCGGTAATGDTPYDNFNIYIRKHDGGNPVNWNECLRLTKNSTDGVFTYGPLPASEIAFSPDSSKVVFAGTDLMGSGVSKLYWVDAQGAFAGAATGTQSNFVIADPTAIVDTLTIDAGAGDTVLNVGFPAAFTIGKDILVSEKNFLTGVYEKGEAARITAIDAGAGTITVSAPLGQAYSAFTATTIGTIEYPVPLAGLGQILAPVNDQAIWLDPAWSASDAAVGCTAPPDPSSDDYGDALLAVRWATPTGFGDYTGTPPGYLDEGNSNANIIMFWGAKNADGLYAHGTSKIMKITDFSGNTLYPLKPKWSPDCGKIAFLAWDVSAGTSPSRTSVYVINLTDSRAGWATATLPITSLTDTGVYKVYDYASGNRPAYFPNWSADGKLVGYSVDRTNTLDLGQMFADNDSFVNTLYGTVDFNQYLEYIEDQPATLGGMIAPQIVGAATATVGTRNEFGMAQCPGQLTGSSCPNGPNYPWTFVSQTAAGSGDLRVLTLDNVSNVSADGGLLFLDGIVTAVFPPGVISSDTVFWNTWPTQYCTGGAAAQNAGGGAGNCPVEPSGEYIVNAGEAREFFPDGTNFSDYVRLVFHFCDNDDDGFVDTGTEGTQIAGFTFNGTNCQIGGVNTATGTIDIDSLAVYNWDDAAAQWVKLEGNVDRVDKTITVFSTHFSRYDTFGFRVGGAPQIVIPLQLGNVHTYPNPWYTTQDMPLKFAADTAAGDGSILVDIKVYDIRGSHVATIQNVVVGGGAGGYGSENNAVTLANWTPANFAGTPLASGVYLYYLHATDLTNGTVVDVTGKLSIIH